VLESKVSLEFFLNCPDDAPTQIDSSRYTGIIHNQMLNLFNVLPTQRISDRRVSPTERSYPHISRHTSYYTDRNLPSASSQARPAPKPRPTQAGQALRLNRRTEKTTPKERPREERMIMEEMARSHCSIMLVHVHSFSISMP
jgi:hypothetical protein